MAHALGLTSCDNEGHALSNAIMDMNERLGPPGGLPGLGVTADLFERVIDGAMADHCHKSNPRLATRDDYRRILSDSL